MPPFRQTQPELSKEDENEEDEDKEEEEEEEKEAETEAEAEKRGSLFRLLLLNKPSSAADRAASVHIKTAKLVLVVMSALCTD